MTKILKNFDSLPNKGRTQTDNSLMLLSLDVGEHFIYEGKYSGAYQLAQRYSARLSPKKFQVRLDKDKRVHIGRIV